MKHKQFFATLAVGTLFGASALLAMRGHDLDLLYLKYLQVRESEQQLKEDKQKLEDELSHAQKYKNRRLRKLNIVVKEAPDEFAKVAVQREVKRQLNSMLDKELTLLENDPELFNKLLDGRTIEVSGQSLTLQVKAVVIGETTSIFIHAVKDVKASKHHEEPPTTLP
ncbi:hypothetical protein [Tumebacillus permanentifrigoris]|uniref:Sporulation membrane protein YtrI C-terminal domain-containing protein n=1 Tax=Tumebacillus permanentifrigoris TaxID=378543 RepID=A0A316D7B2_9BACL|nr:hypothetical protein [Tumebacillus permanentifrigoris]PWK10327.1 hypothetical protein C7459_112149 [Tumebacillus permanentifrigoris]